MEEYYIRTPGHNESRGPFNMGKLQTLVEAEQVTKNTLYYDEDREEWLPIGMNETFKEKLFPERKKLNLRAHVETKAAVPEDEPDEESALDVDKMLAAAEGDTEETRHLKDAQKSFERATAMSSMSLALIMLLSSVIFVAPHMEIIFATTGEGSGAINRLLNSPFFLIAAVDLILAIALMLAVTELFPVVRVRAMLAVGFGGYLGWAIGDPTVQTAFIIGGIGLFYATMARSMSSMLAAVLLGAGSYCYLAYLSISGRFNGFFEVINFNWVPS